MSIGFIFAVSFSVGLIHILLYFFRVGGIQEGDIEVEVGNEVQNGADM